MAFKGAKGSVTIIDKATKPLRSIAQAFANLGKSSKNTNKDLSSTQKAINSSSKAQNRLNRVNQNIKRNTRDIGSQAVGVAALALSFKAALSPAIKFEQSMKDLEAVAFGAADSTVPVTKNMALLSEQAKKLGASTAFSATQAAEGQIFLAKAGFKTNQILSSMPSLLDLAAASGTELGRTSDILSDLLGAFGKQAKDSGALADLLAAATSSANVDMESLFETLKVAAPIGVTAGQSMQEMVAATALLGNVGIKGSMGATALKNAMTRLAAPASAGKKAIKELGINVADASGKMRPISKIIGELAIKSGKLSQVKRIATFEAIFGKQALAGSVSLAKFAKSGAFEKTIKNFSNVEGVSKKMAKIRMDSTEGSIIQLMSAVEGLAISFGSVLTPILRGIANVMTQLTAPMQSFIANNESLIKGIGIFAGVLLTTKIAALAYTSAMWLISPAITAMSAAMKIAKIGMIAFNFVMNANPIGLLITGLGILGLAGVALVENWDSVKSFFADLWETIGAFDFSNIIGSLGKIADVFGFGDSEINQTATTNIAPQLAQQAIQNNQTTNVPVAIKVNIADGQVKGIETSGATKTDVFLNNGAQS